MAYKVTVSLVNEDRGYIYSEYEEELGAFALDGDGRPIMGDVYRSAQSEYGRCQSSVYVDVADGPPKRVGWYFVSRQEYEDYREHGERFYLRGAWVSVVETSRGLVAV